MGVLWHAAGRTGATADFLKGLIKLAAAGVKVREGRAAGVRRHAERAVDLLQRVAAEADVERAYRGLSLIALIRASIQIASQAEGLAGGGVPEATRNLPVRLQLG